VPRTPKRIAGPAVLPATATTRYTVPASTKTILRHIHVNNPSQNSAGTIGVSIGADAAATRIFDNYPIPANSVLDHFCYYVLEAAEVIQDNGSTFFTVTYDGEEYTPG
jgi:hypothetical protein